MGKRIEVKYKDNVPDPIGNSVKKRIHDFLGINVDNVLTVDCYNIDYDLSDEEIEKLSKNILCDPIIQTYSYKTPLAKDFTFAVEVGFRPGVTDNVAKTAAEAIHDLLGINTTVFTSKQYLINGNITKEQATTIANKLLANDLIEKAIIFDKPQTNIIPILPKVTDKTKPIINTYNLDVSDDKLMEISKKGVLALNLDEMKTIQSHFKKLGRNPTDGELEILAQTWSEHCKHKIFNATIDYDENGKTRTIKSLFKNYIKRTTDEVAKRTDYLVSVFVDNSGVIKFTDKYNIAFKVETHNSPSALDPYGGALTGIVGVNRDTLGTGIGARPIFNTDIFCFASPNYSGDIPKRLMHPKRIFEGVRRGVEHGGNKSGIPTVNGSIVFHERFLGKPLVYCGTGGIMPAELHGRDTSKKIIEPGDIILMAGGRVGKDGIHGATFSSEELHAGSPATAVQIGDPITQKKMLDFLIETRDLGYIKSITDNGAGGLASSVGEMAETSNGAEIDLARVPVKYLGLQPWEILISEAQERMTIGVSQSDLDIFLSLAKRRGVEVTPIGTFTDSGNLVVKYDGKPLVDLDMGFLHNGLPEMKLYARWQKPKHKEPTFSCPEDLTKELKQMLARPNICSKETTVRQYDHEVQAASVVKPFTGKDNDGPSDAAVIKPLPDTNKGVVIAHGIVPRYSDIDTYHMTACAVDEALRNHVAVGGSLDVISALDNFCWCDPVKSDKTPDGDYKLAQLVRSNEALYDYCTAYNMPLISGKDSMKNDYMIDDTKISIPPTVLISTMGIIDDVTKAVTMDAKNAEDLVYVLGTTNDELGGSEYYASKGFIGNNVPKVDAKTAFQLYKNLNEAMKKGLVASCHDISDGGLAVALAETAFSGGLGMTLDLTNLDCGHNLRDDNLLFSESQSRFVATVKPEHKDEFEKRLNDDCISLIGTVNHSGNFMIERNGKIVVDSDIIELKKAWQGTLQW